MAYISVIGNTEEAKVWFCVSDMNEFPLFKHSRGSGTFVCVSAVYFFLNCVCAYECVERTCNCLYAFL